MLSPAQNPDLIAGFYAAATHADRWNGALSALCAAFNADKGLLYRQSRPSGQPTVVAARNWPAAAGRVILVPQAPPRRAGRAASAGPAPAILDALQPPPAGGRHVISATVKLDGTALVGMGLHRQVGAPDFTEADRAALDGVGQHVAAALRLQALLDAERTACAIRGAVLDQYAHGVVIATGSGMLIFANRAAGAIAAAGGLVLGQGPACIGRMQPDEAARLEALITSVTGGGMGGCVRITRAGLPVVAAIVEPLPAGMADAALIAGLRAGGLDDAAGERLALISLRDLGATMDAAASHLMDLFGLTAAEAGIVPQLLSGESVSMIAQSRGVAVSTVKTQAARVLAKTGASNLRALATMISALGCG
jgi:DNA-binding CsgD family transcriptional regulator